MHQAAWADSETLRRVFPAWSIVVPDTFAETFVDESYWHAWDEHRSISMTSLLITDGTRPVTAAEFLEQLPEMPVMAGTPVDELPPGLLGVAVTCPSTPPARASLLLSAILATEGRALLVTITSDDLAWARRIFKSIRTHVVDPVTVH